MEENIEYNISNDNNIIINNNRNNNNRNNNNNNIINNNENNNNEFIIEKLYDILINNKNYFNDKKTKIFTKENYDFIINIINKTNNFEFINFLNYFNNINIQIFKIIINGFIEFDFNENQEKNILEIISKAIYIYFNKNMFYFIYKKLSKLYRRHNNTLKDIRSIKQFEKLLKVWKLLYSIEELPLPDIKENDNQSIKPITFYTEKFKINDNIDINIEKLISEKESEIILNINFVNSPILDVNKVVEDFYFFKIFDRNNHFFMFKYNTIFNKNNNIEPFSKVNNIIIKLKQFEYTIYVNNIKLPSVKESFNFDSISHIKILNYFYGEISSIVIQKKFLSNENKNKIIEIKRNNNSEIKCNVFYENVQKNNKKPKDDLCKYNGTIFSNYLYNNIKKNMKRGKKDLNEIEYFGGFACFIPLFRLIKYIIINLSDNDNFENNNEKENYIIKSLIWVKDILIIIFKLICLKENNYNNFINIIVPLIASLSEISYTINNLISSEKIPNDFKSILFNDSIIYDLDIIIMNLDIPYNVKNLYSKIFEIDNNYHFSMEYIIFDINKIKNIDFYWYYSIIFNIISFILIYFDSGEKVPKKLIEQLNNIISHLMESQKNIDDIRIYFIKAATSFLHFVNFYCLGKNESFDNIFEFQDMDPQENSISFFFKYLLNLIKIILNVKYISKKKGISYNNNSVIHKLILLLSEKNFKIEDENKKNEVKNQFKNSYNDIVFLQNLFPFLEEEWFISKEELLMNEFIDYHGQYHHLIKELFVFNRLWSNQKLFYMHTLEKRKKSNLKYKNINYYSRNFQRPVIYPILDYKYRYPKFSVFEKDKVKDFYNIPESEDDYDFDLDCPKLDEIVQNYQNNIYKGNKNSINIEVFNACLVKPKYHLKGKILIFNTNSKYLIYFYSNNYNFENNNENISTCNNIKQNNNNILCYGSLFECPTKEKYKKMRIVDINIRMILKRIYYYRKSALEIFTQTKSYFFNFYSEDDLNNFFNIINNNFLQKSYFPIEINNYKVGYAKLNKNIIKGNDLKNSNNNDFVQLISNTISKNDLNEMSIFDIILLINLISNRSYIDLSQYPVFPLLFFYDKEKKENAESEYKKVERDLKKHIGFQTKTTNSSNRTKLFINSFKNDEEEDELNDKKHYFETNYSTPFYTSNYMIRLFPFSLCAIEYQGDGFDDPNRLFNSIEETFYNISYQKSDLRELIPEFFYLPEMFININCINFHKKSNGILVNDVIIPKNIDENKINENDIIINEIEDDMTFFLFVDYMKKELESLKKDLSSWLRIIFGDQQQYRKKKKKGGLLFRKESVIDINNITYEEYSKDVNIMKSVEFGLIPLQTIFDDKILDAFDDRKYIYEELDEETKKELDNHKKLEKKIKKEKKKNKIKNDNDSKQDNNNVIQKKINDIYVYKVDKNNNLDYLFDRLDIKFIIDNTDNNGKLKVYYNDFLIKEIIDHNDKIRDIYYNPRLNMFATISLDGLACIYIIPNKLFSIIKHSNKYYDKIFLSSNPFPTIITYEKQNNTLTSYSINGILIKQKHITMDEIDITVEPLFNIYGGGNKDRIKAYNESIGFYELYNIPFFDKFKDK